MILDQIRKGSGGYKILAKPTVTVGTYTYDETAQGPTIVWPPNVEQNCVVTNATATNPGTYTLRISLKNASKMMWTDFTTADLTYEYTIAKIPVTKPTFSGTSFTYNGSAQGPTISWATGMEQYCDVSGATATAVGSYLVVASLKDSSITEWADGTTADVTCAYTIVKINVTKPTFSGTSKTYNGSSQGPTISWASGMEQYCNTSGATATNAGSYTVTVSLKDSSTTQWSDGTTANVTQAWSIARATGSISISPTTFTLNSSTNSKAFAVSWTGDGSVSASSNDTSKVTVSPATLSAAGNVTATGKGVNGTVTLTVTLAQGTNYTGATATATITCSYVPLKSFSAATEAELLQMVQAADAGQIDLYDDCGWRVGQERSVSLSAISSSGTYDGVSWSVGENQPVQTITLVLMHKGLYDLVTPVKAKGGASRTKCSFIVGVKEILNMNGYLDSSWMNYQTWNIKARRNWCNAGFRGALPANIRNCFKKFYCVTGTYNGTKTGGPANVTSEEYFVLPAQKEVEGGTPSYECSNEYNALTQFTWYETASNRVKTIAGSPSSISNGWWTRSFVYNSSGYNVLYGYYGTASSDNLSNTWGLSPFGCM